MEEYHMRDHIPRSKIVLNELFNETTKTSTRVVGEVGTSTRVVDTTSSSHIYPPQELRKPQHSGRVINSPTRYLGLTETQVVVPDDGVEDP
uniref:hypothetical protein n=1 Tax=Picosynechococcus sp. (strain ATCC 27264 / PCC 7002 / PR-6) TaxID=32049 RepID=UPI0030DB8F17